MADDLALLRAEHRLGFGFRLFYVFFFVNFVRRRGGGGQFPDEGAARDFDDEVFSGVAIHAFAQAGIAGFGDEARDVELADEVVQVVVGLENDVAAAAAVAAAGATLGDVGLAMEGDGAFAAVAGFGVNFYLINKHEWMVRPASRRDILGG